MPPPGPLTPGPRVLTADPAGGATTGSWLRDLSSDPLSDTDPAGGLHKFDLGMVPASVTPPASWRRAAWFSIGSAAAAFGGLLFATFALVDTTTTVQGLDFPGLPRGGEYPPLPGTQDDTEDPDSPQAPLPWAPLTTAAPSEPLRLSVPPSVGTSPAPGTPGAGGAPEPTTPGEGGPTTGPGDGDGDGDAPPEPTTPPPPTTQPPTESRQPLAALLGNRAVQPRSDEYFTAVRSNDLRGAYQMTTGSLRREGYESFAARYAGAKTIEVTGVSTHASSTVTTLRITRTDGSVVTQRRELQFTGGSEPMVWSDREL